VLDLALLACLAIGDPLPALPAHLEVLEGRVHCATGEGVLELRGPERARELTGRAYIEVAPLARARVGWEASASFEVIGPAVLEWTPAATAEQVLRVRVIECDTMHLEVRRGSLELELPGGNRAELDRSAICLRSVGSSEFELRHDAGLPLFVSTQSDERTVWPPLTVLPGARLRLGKPGAAPLAVAGTDRRVIDRYGRGARAWESARPSEPWSHFSWPWSEPASAEVPLARRDAR
jgi:hypothetical protein